VSRAATIVGDVSGLPDYNFGPTSLGWWGVLGVMLIEGIGLLLAIGAYLYLLPYEHTVQPPPSLRWGMVFTVVAIASELPNARVSRRARQRDLPAVKSGLVLMTAIGVALLAVRALELATLNVGLGQHAYGPVVRVLLVLHALYMATGIFASGMLAATLSSPADGRRFSDAVDNALYWHFVVWSSVVLYVIVYWTPRWL
jgi:heme/copper-type cytochrome/quinol oxidase subunit 3